MSFLFMFYVGGDFGNSNVELHDVRFSIGETAQDCYADLRKQWWGDPKSLHLDCWGAVEQADGYDIALVKGASEHSRERLYFCNLGGYDHAEFGELHQNVLIVASDVKAATRKALTQIRGWKLAHKDNLFEVEKAVDVSAWMRDYGYSLVLTKAKEDKPFVFNCAYVRIA